MNPVLLGYPDEEISQDSNSDYSVSKIGGLPVSYSEMIISFQKI